MIKLFIIDPLLHAALLDFVDNEIIACNGGADRTEYVGACWELREQLKEQIRDHDHEWNLAVVDAHYGRIPFSWLSTREHANRFLAA